VRNFKSESFDLGVAGGGDPTLPVLLMATRPSLGSKGFSEVKTAILPVAQAEVFDTGAGRIRRFSFFAAESELVLEATDLSFFLGVNRLTGVD